MTKRCGQMDWYLFPSHEGNRNAMNILLIDDDAEDRMLFCEALRESEVPALVTSTNSCRDIHEAIMRTDPDLIILDGHTPPIGALECLQKIYGGIDRSKTKVIIYSGSLSPREVDQLRNAGVDHILTKPTTFERLKADINIICSMVAP